MSPEQANIPAAVASNRTYHLTSSATQVRRTLEEVQTRLRAADVGTDLGDTAQIILAEVLNNIVEHAYGFQEGLPIGLTIMIRSNGLWCETCDEGVAMPNGVPPIGVMPTIDPTAPAELPEGGFGWAMVRTLTEGITYTRNGSVNHLSFLIPITSG